MTVVANRSELGQLATAAGESGLDVLASGRWPTRPDDDLPGVAGFIVSAFNPIVVESARRALTAYYGEMPEKGGSVERDHEVIGVLVVSRNGDAMSARAVAAAVDAGDRVGPLMFFQSVPNAVAGYVAAKWGLSGPVTAISPVGPSIPDAFAAAVALLDDGDADRVLVIFVEEPGVIASIPRARRSDSVPDLDAVGPSGGGLAALVTRAVEVRGR